MPKWIVRYTVDYSIAIEARDAEEAVEKALQHDVGDWDKTESEYDAEKEGE